MASGGSTGRAASGSRAFDFGSDDVLCSYDDYAPPHDHPNGKRSEPSPSPSPKDFHESRMGRPLVNVYGQQEEYPKEDLISAVEKCMKKYADNLLQFLEGISGRLTQLELYCFKLERSIGDIRSDMVRDQSEKNLQLKSLDKHLQEVHRSVQILRDKQELVETQKELAKLQLTQKESSSASHSQKSDEGVPPSVSELKKVDDTADVPNPHLALVPRQASAPLPLPSIASEQNQPYKELPMQQPGPASLNMPQDHYIPNQAGTFYAQRQPLPDQQRQPLQPELHYVQQKPQIQEQTPPQQQAFPQYQQQWPQPPPQQFPQQAIQPQQPPLPQARPQTPPSYPPYPPQQPTNPITETYPSSMPMQVPYSSVPQPGGSRVEAGSYGYGGPVSTGVQPPPQYSVQRQPQPQGNQSSFGPTLNKGSYTGAAPYPPQPNPIPRAQGYSTMYNSIDGSQGAASQSFQPGSYPPSNVSSLQQPPPSNTVSLHPGPQLMRNHPYGEMIEKAVSMGYPRDHVASVIHMMGQTGQPVDLNALLDRLDTLAPRGWSG